VSNQATAAVRLPPVGTPDFGDDHDRHRLYIKQRLAAAFRIFARYGFTEGRAGHITARDPEFADRFWVNPHAMAFAQIRASDLICVDHSGQVVVGDRPVNLAAFTIHSRIHAARPDVVAAAHAHTPHGKAWSVFRRELDPLTQSSCAFYRDHVVFGHYDGAVIETSEGDLIAEALGCHKAAILANHGNLTVGASVDEAAFWFIAMERACEVQLLVDASHRRPTLLTDEQASKAAGQVGLASTGWKSFQPLWDWITAEEPALLD